MTVSMPAGRVLDSFAVAPDGQMLAYAAEAADGRLHLFLKGIDGADGDEQDVVGAGGAHDPFFSPDGKSVGFFSRDALWRISVSGGEAQRVCAAPGDGAGGTWTDSARIVFAPLGGQGLSVVSSGGGTPASLTTLSARDGELAHGWPHALPGGAILFTVSQRGRDPHLETLSAAGQRGPRLVPAIGQAEFASSGHIVYSYLGDLYELPFDRETLKATGVPVVFAKGVQTASGFRPAGAFRICRLPGKYADVGASRRRRRRRRIGESGCGRSLSSLGRGGLSVPDAASLAGRALPGGGGQLRADDA